MGTTAEKLQAILNSKNAIKEKFDLPDDMPFSQYAENIKGGGADVILGVVDENGDFQPLAFNGTEASNGGEPETVENYHSWNSILPPPDNSGGGECSTESTAFYKCAEVLEATAGGIDTNILVIDGIETENFAGCNQRYILQSGDGTSRIFIGENNVQYGSTDCKAKISWSTSSPRRWRLMLVNSNDISSNVAGVAIRATTDADPVGAWQGYDSSITGNITASWYEQPAITENTWSGYKAVLNPEGYYEFEETVTTGLTYGKGFIPVRNNIYNADATARISELFEGGKKPLTFTAVLPNSTVSSTKQGTPVISGIRYSIDNGNTWNMYTVGDTITLTDIGDSVQFMNLNEQLSLSSSDLFNFQLTGRIAASGNVQSMLNFKKECVPKCFFHLLSNNEALVSAPELPATTLAEECYWAMFYNDINLTVPPELPATTLAHYCYAFMFEGSGITSLKVPFTEWGQCPGWVKYLPSTGTFYKPSALPEQFGNDYIPSGWTVVNTD